MNKSTIEENSGMTVEEWKELPHIVEIEKYTLHHPCGAKTSYRMVKQKVNNGTFAKRLQFWGCQGGWRFSFEKDQAAFIEDKLTAVA